MQGSARLRAAALACVLFAALASAARAQQVPVLDWQPCGDAANVQCANAGCRSTTTTAKGKAITLFVAKSPATDHQARSSARCS